MQIILGLVLITIGAFGNNYECRAVQWPFSRQVAKINVPELSNQPRMFLYSYLYYELSRPPKERIEGLAKKLFHFLINTEPNEIRFNLLSALEYAADLNSQNPTVISISEICHLEEKAFRQPSSVEKKLPSKNNHSINHLRKELKPK